MIKKLLQITINLILYSTLLISTKTFAEIQAKVFTTPQGITVILLNDPSTDLISANIAFKDAGSKNDPNGQEGLVYTSMQMLYRSSSDGINKNQRARKIKELGALDGIGINIGSDNIFLQFKCPEENLLPVLKIVSGIFTNYNLEDQELNKLKTFTSDIQLETTSEVGFAKHALNSKIFLQHPYGLPPQGLANSIQTLGLNDLKSTIKNIFAKNNLIISLVGNLDQKKATQYIEQSFAKLPAKANVKLIPTVKPKLDGSLQTIVKSSQQSGVVFALNAPEFNTQDFYAMLILNRILGGTPFTSRLWKEVRENRGLAYEIGTRLDNNKLSNILTGWFKSDNNHSKEVINIIKEELKKLQTTGVTAQEVIDAKSGLIGEFALYFITSEQTCDYLLNFYLLGGTVKDLNDYKQKINDVTLEQVNKVAAKYLNINDLTMVLVGNPPQDHAKNT